MLDGVREEIEELELDRDVSVVEDEGSEDSAENIVQMFGRQKKPSSYEMMRKLENTRGPMRYNNLVTEQASDLL